MILGKLFGKVNTKEFIFKADQEVKNLEYVKVYHKVYDFVLAQIVEVTASSGGVFAKSLIIGYPDNKRVKPLRIPFEPESEVLLADDDFIRRVISLPEGGAYIGKLEGRDIKVELDLNKMLTKHVAVLAKSGAGKSYTVGVLIEELLEKKVPLIIIDPHGEYSTLKKKAEQNNKMALFNIAPKAYPIIEFGDLKQGLNPIQLNNKLSRSELVHMLPKLNTTQQGILYSVIRSEQTDFDQLLLSLESEDSMAKWSLINLVEELKNYNIFSNQPMNFNDLLIPGTATIFNLKGFSPEIQEIIMFKLANDLFALRKQNKIPPFFLVVEEAHNFCPERSFGEASSNKILRTIASEGRKFGLGLCVITQRPARLDKSVLSQCTTQIVLKVTNPHDLKAISTSLEGLNSESEKEIKNLPVGTALVTGVVDIPLIVNVRPRRSAHGGEAINIVGSGDILPIIKPSISKNDLIMMGESNKDEKHLKSINNYIKEVLKPVARVTCEDNEGEFFILIDLTNNELIIDINDYKTKKISRINDLNKEEQDVIKFLLKNKILKPLEMNISQSTIITLLSQGFIRKKDDSIILSNAYFYKSLRNAASYQPIIYDNSPSTKRSARFSIDDVKKLLKNIINVIDIQEAWLITYVTK